MFQPNSVRGLLSRRNKTRLSSQDTANSVSSAGDPELDAMVETKLILKDVEYSIQSIRQWRSHQKQLLEQKLAKNEEVAKVTVGEYLKHLDRQQQRQQQQNKKIISKLTNLSSEQILKAGQWTNSDTNLFQYVSNSNKLVEELKSDKQVGTIQTTHSQFISQLQNLNDFVWKKEKGEGEGETKPLDREQLKSQLKQIDQELKEIQDLLKD